MKKIKIAASLLAADFSQLEKEVKMVERAGAELLHLDIMDGHFVKNISFGPGVLKALRRRTKLVFDTHLMIKNPKNYLAEFAKSGSDIITFHIETTKNPKELIKSIRKLGCSPGISLNPRTSLSRIKPFLKDVDLILIMSVNPGLGGQKFIPSSLTKLRELKSIIRKKNLSVDLEVDGGINRKTAKKAVSAGANILVAGTYIFHSRNPQKKIKELRCSGSKKRGN
ncbi:MAG: ribulose-phosphate 3-epimerase [bacterium (Candidatus Ratteibacteria) CG_4_10_14_3_um_filter_41_18]|uniref:Ribulose-phosphate 3-epimerase n=4 Tax=Candidatus Ratteibacteria TaxID=2979319 RepID=A0A2M7E9Q6_9BACT|nr:MAG: ribulose-phosphate 3-epimerase [Candidatus Omnitrophica bacterium CG1_02_41_171]PIV64449.1 MAG: ribulose-phosphate 3-epimerase [bacterium (Candidatus Ratteibacteria) CG01_land_8_20_14_3_00_40_19]PIW32299.1 MAG: ribulose-phosphate 3-epimerase [bacterium (Candidatus Ratteibacteria) CG15_BIG_FIL_POST_REV_8_21_14_020_41_12]PIW73957.1 MAG: ribulose-phosphate 3-epimerase [bacterium (Candidatus Ratteibacteria) CG_4_8_14_3_um_filter_41_36]PIX76899.1 MAG: ribulose-phosphate 3-epimerase [bacteriu